MKNNFSEILYLENWLDKTLKIAKELNQKIKKKNKKNIFLISTTKKQTKNLLPYNTPLRETEFGFLSGVVVFSQTQAILVANKLDGIVDYIFVDAEKKLGVTINAENNISKHFKISHLIKKDGKKNIEYGNISGAVRGVIKKSFFHEYKPNDLTIDSVWTFVSNYFRGLSGKKITIVGSGNIGFKLGLKFVESGANVELVRRSVEAGQLFANTINLIKSEYTIAEAHYDSDPIKAAIRSDVLIGATDGVEIINWEMIQSMNKNGIIIDIGKGTINKEVAKKAISNKLKIFRADITAALSGTISTILRNIKITENHLGRKKLKKNIFIVSGGQFALENDIIVDNINKPKNIIGVADGNGDLKIKLNKNLISKLKQVEELIK